jgi:hypothetical protein
MGASTTVRWEGWEGRSLEHLALQEDADGVTAESVILGRAEGQPFAASYRISCDPGWRTREVAVGLIGSSRQLLLTADGEGRWRAGHGAELPALRGAVDVDITATPFTNMLPIRRLGLAAGAAADILTVYITVPDLTVTTDRQRYTCHLPNRSYIYESLDSDFKRQIETDDRSLVLTFPGLFRGVP